MKRKYPPLEIAAPVLFALIFIVSLIYSRLEPHVEDVDASYVRERSGQPGYVLVDARPIESYLGKSPRLGIPGGHIPGAVNFPLSVLSMKRAEALKLLDEGGITRDKTVIIYCNTGVLSSRLADQLVRHFKFSSSKLKNYRGGIVEWVRDTQNILLPPDHETGFIGSHALGSRGK